MLAVIGVSSVLQRPHFIEGCGRKFCLEQARIHRRRRRGSVCSRGFHLRGWAARRRSFWFGCFARRQPHDKYKNNQARSFHFLLLLWLLRIGRYSKKKVPGTSATPVRRIFLRATRLLCDRESSMLQRAA